MAFESKRLRVQLPCKKAGTLVEKEADPEAVRLECPGFVSPTGCHPFVSPHHPPCPGGSPVICFRFRTPYCRFYDSPICNPPYQTEVGCGLTEVGCGRTEIDCWGQATVVPETCLLGSERCTPGSPIDLTTELIVVDPDPEDPETVLLRPEDLGRFRRQLQAELERIEALEQRKGEVEGQLEELDSAEKALKRRSKSK